MSAVWLVPLTLVAVAIGYFGLVFVGFVGEGLGGGMPTRDVLMVLCTPALALGLAAALGLGTARTTSRLAYRVVRLRALPPWLLGLAGAVVGGAAGVAVFRLFLSAGTQLMAD
ncbi:hypothetical protein ASD06_05650 [Angustibacter sp. Root456]|nr:hypothetical protein ASD06_05650 [Angustibacter sp. Root456]